jgi:hypothetical protein
MHMRKASMYLSGSLVVAALVAIDASTPALTDLPLQSSVSVHGITWTFSHGVRVGKFVNGDFYIAGACTVSAVTPAPTVSPARNGSVVNIPPADQGTGFDDRSANYRPAFRKYPPIALAPGDALVSTISISDSAKAVIHAWLSTGNGTESICKTAGVLTCMAAPVATDAFRPSYCDRGQKLYYADSLRWKLLPNLAHVNSMTPALLHEWSWHFMNSPWLDACFFGFDAPLDYMPHYSAETGRAVGIAGLFLISDFSQAQKDSLMKGFVQYGIDLWGIVRGCNASRGWQAHGGHGTGRKWPMILSGILLGDSAMAKPTRTYPTLRIGEDMQTAWDFCWATGDSNFVYTGHQGLWNGQPVNTSPGWGPYEGTPPAQWYCCEPGYTAPLGEAYRRCCTSHAWIAEALAARLVNAMDLWNHPAFFGYCDRWMTETHYDSAEILAVKAARGWDFSADWERQGACWDAITNDMWKAYRNSVPNAGTIENFAKAHPGQWVRITGNSYGRGYESLKIAYGVGHPTTLKIVLYDLSGRQIRELLNKCVATPGGSLVWDGKDRAGNPVGSGCYQVVVYGNGACVVKRISIIL